ncbi:MAG: hypothetical protein CME06_14270 [Gemmatimonadetes bacterium]|nr:hypothetical protein [Gemmatimonadota bacterium]
MPRQGESEGWVIGVVGYLSRSWRFLLVVEIEYIRVCHKGVRANSRAQGWGAPGSGLFAGKEGVAFGDTEPLGGPGCEWRHSASQCSVIPPLPLLCAGNSPA